jgi:hypothetical protein
MGMSKEDLKDRIKKLEKANAEISKELLAYRRRFGPLIPAADITLTEMKTAEDLGYVPVATPTGEVQYQSNQGYSRDNEGKYAEVKDAT